MSHNLWFTGESAGDQFWLALIVPWRAGQPAPVVVRPAARAISIDGRSISFEPTAASGLVIDAKAISDRAQAARAQHG
jgi:hypothetical protein